MMKKRQAEASKYHVVSVSPDEGHCTCYETKEDLVDSIERGHWDEYVFTDGFPLWGGAACVIKGTIVVPKITKRAVEVEIE